MRALKTILIILVALGVLVLVLALAGPGAYRVERSTTIVAPSGDVYPHVSHLARMKDWGPWQEMDPEQVQTLTGTDGMVGATWYWEGKVVGKGSQTITELEQDRSVRSDLHFVEPMEYHAKVDLGLEDMGDSTRVTWVMHGENGFMGRIMGMFMDMDKMIGPDLEVGLANLKSLVEREHAQARAELAARTFNGHVVEIVERPAMTYVGKRARVRFADLPGFYASAIPAAFQAVAASGLAVEGPPSGVYIVWDEKGRATELLAGVPLTEEWGGRPGVDVVRIPASRALRIVYKGGYDDIASAHAAMEAMMKAKGLVHDGPVIEEYVTGPPSEPDTAKWATHVYYPIE